MKSLNHLKLSGTTSTQVKYLRDGRAPIPVSENISRIMSSNKARDTKPEIRLRKALWHEGIKGYRLYWKKIIGKPDIAFPSKKIAIFINGCFWHRCPHCNPKSPKSNKSFWETKFQKNIQRDLNQFQILESQKWKVLIIWECQIKSELNSQVANVKNLILES